MNTGSSTVQNNETSTSGEVIPEAWYKAMWQQHTTWFVVFAIVVSAVTWIVMGQANGLLRETHDTIVKAHERQMRLTDSVLVASHTLLSREGKTLTPLQARALCNNLEESAKALATYGADHQTERLLELEFAKIQHEYEVLNLWCALLTIVFLIFSFFSIFKTNEMTRQGEEALQQLRDTATTAREKSDSIDTQVTTAETRVNNKMNELSGQAETKFTNLESKITRQETKQSDIDSRLVQNTTTIDGLNQRLGNISSELNTIIDDKKADIDQLITNTLNTQMTAPLSEIRNSIATLTAKIEELNQRIDSIPPESSTEEQHEINEEVDTDEPEEETSTSEDQQS